MSCLAHDPELEGTQPKVTIRQLALDIAPRDDLALVGMAAATQQDMTVERVLSGIASSAHIVEPTYSPSKLYTVYNRDPDVASAVDALVDAVVGAGVTVKVATNTSAISSSTASEFEPEKKPDMEQRRRLDAFLTAPNEDPAETFVTINRDLLRDIKVTGQAYPHFGRTGPHVSRVWYAPSVKMRRGEDPNIFYRVDGLKVVPFRRLGAQEVGVSQKVTVTAGDTKVEVQQVLELRARDGQKKNNDPTYADGVRLQEWEDLKDLKLAVGEDFNISSLPEVGFLKSRDPLNDYYGRPDVLPAFLSSVVSRSILRYNAAFFNNNAIPPMAIVVTGGELGDEGTQEIRKTLARRGTGMDSAHKLLILELIDPDVSVKFEKLNSENQNEGAFIELQEKEARRIFAVFRVPYSYVNQDSASAEGTLKEAVRIFKASVVQPLQQWLAAFWNRVLREHMGITDWEIEWEPVESEDLASRVQAFVNLLLRGVLSINDVRSELGKKPVEGGDDNFITIQGTGVVLINMLRQLGQRAVEGKPAGDLMPSGGVQTPARGAGPVLTPGKGVA